LSKLRILLADDHALVRAGLRRLVESLPEVEVVAEAGDGHEALRLMGERQPDLALLDVSMPGLGGLEVALRAAKEHPMVRVVMLSMYADPEYVRQALRAGAAGYLLKDASPGELELALRAVARGDTWLSPAVSRVAAGALASERAEPGPFELLTSRQREMLQLIAEGNSTKEIAFRLGLSVKTVEAHRAQLMQRLGVRGVAGLVRYAIHAGIVRPHS